MTARTSSLVHPKYKTKYSVGNWREYEHRPWGYWEFSNRIRFRTG